MFADASADDECARADNPDRLELVKEEIMRRVQGDRDVCWFVKVSKPIGKDGMGERWQKGGVCPTINVFEKQTSTRAVVAVMHCYANHAQDSRVNGIRANPTLGINNGDCLRCLQSLAVCQ